MGRKGPAHFGQLVAMGTTCENL